MELNALVALMVHISKKDNVLIIAVMDFMLMMRISNALLAKEAVPHVIQRDV